MNNIATNETLFTRSQKNLTKRQIILGGSFFPNSILYNFDKSKEAFDMKVNSNLNYLKRRNHEI